MFGSSDKSLITSYVKTTDTKRKVADTSMDGGSAGNDDGSGAEDDNERRHRELLEILKGI